LFPRRVNSVKLIVHITTEEFNPKPDIALPSNQHPGNISANNTIKINAGVLKSRTIHIIGGLNE